MRRKCSAPFFSLYSISLLLLRDEPETSHSQPTGSSALSPRLTIPGIASSLSFCTDIVRHQHRQLDWGEWLNLRNFLRNSEGSMNQEYIESAKLFNRVRPCSIIERAGGL